MEPKTLFLMRGCPGCGKTTWVKAHVDPAHVVSSDDIRQRYTDLPRKEIEERTWADVKDEIASLLGRGTYAVLDATNTNTRFLGQWQDLADTYSANVCVIDMTNVDEATCRAQNNLRTGWQKVPDAVIARHQEFIHFGKIPYTFTQISTEDAAKIFEGLDHQDDAEMSF